jgi:hypothetical protein
MALSFTKIPDTVPVGTFVIVNNMKEAVGPWRSWAWTRIHEHYSKVNEIPASVWKRNTNFAPGVEMYC